MPAFEDLTKEQDVVYNLDLDENFIVSGPPGTGKSVMALYRAQVMTFDDRNPDVLMYSQVLRQYSEQAARDLGVEGTISTFHSWFWKYWKTNYGKLPPTLEGNSFELNWNQIINDFMHNPPEDDRFSDLIIDEGQDLSENFYQLARFAMRTIVVFADENQQLSDNNTTLEEIKTSIGAKEHIKLRMNYRNTVEIHKVSSRFYSGSPTGISLAPQRSGDFPTLRRYENSEEFVEFIVRYSRSHSDKTIGIACPNAATQARLYASLVKSSVSRFVQQYISGNIQHKLLDFDSPGIILLQYKSMKGLEFDTVFVPELQNVDLDPSSSSTRMIFYVVMSRARDELHVSWSGESNEPAILGSLTDGEIRRI